MFFSEHRDDMVWPGDSGGELLRKEEFHDLAYKKTCFWPSLKAGNWRAAAFTASAMAAA